MGYRNKRFLDTRLQAWPTLSKDDSRFLLRQGQTAAAA